jgi:hypothetical protein
VLDLALYSLKLVRKDAELALLRTLPFSASDPMELVHCHMAKQPTRPCEKVSGVPRVVSTIIMKLLAKTAEERYQTAAGVESDLRRCLTEWQTRGCIDEFALGGAGAIASNFWQRSSVPGACNRLNGNTFARMVAACQSWPALPAATARTKVLPSCST